MKTIIQSATIFLSILSITFFASCNADEDNSVTPIEKSINLTAANGEKLASDINELKKLLSVDIADKYGKDVDFVITSIEHIDLSHNGYASIINYRTTDGITSNIMLSNINLGQNKNVSKVLKSRSESGKVEQYTYSCSEVSGKTCSPGCSVSVTIDRETGVKTSSCTCKDECTLTKMK